MEKSLSGKRVIVTGASQGIGRDIAIRLSQIGAQVIAIARSEQHLNSLKNEQPKIEIVKLDVAGNWNSVEETLESYQPFDMLVNNAGVAILGPLENVTETDIDNVFQVNVKSLIHMTQLVAKSLKSRKQKGSIVNVSSQASQAGLLDHTVYCASKGAVDAFTRCAAAELGPFGIRVNAVNPTVIMTDMGKLGWSDPAKAGPMIEKIPLKRFGEVSEVTDAVVYLLSDMSSMVNGHCLPVDGGFLAC